MSPEWKIIEGENTPRGCPASPSSDVESCAVAPVGPNSNLGPGQSILQTDFEQTASFVTATNDRQRTAQACDKCRERKTKCSGDHPVCHRCTARGLICQYSSREPRPRGPSKARLRNAISSVELRTQHNINTERRGLQPAPLTLPPKQVQQYRSQEYTENGPTAFPHRRVASFPRPQHDSQHYFPSGTISNAAVYDTQDLLPLPYENHSYITPQATPPMQMPSPRFINGNFRPHYREVRRVQSHSTLIGGGKDQNHNMRSPMSFQSNLGEPASYDAFHMQMSLPLSSMLGPPGGAPSGPQHERQDPRSTDPHPWGYHSDGGSSGSDPRSTGESISYSPTSSEDVPEPNSRSTSRLDIAPPASFDFSHLHHHSHLHFNNHLNENAYSINPQASYSDSSPAILDLNHRHHHRHHHHMQSRNMDTDHDIHPGHRLVYPSPTMPMRVSMLQGVKPEPGQQELYNFLHSAPDTDLNPFNGISQTTSQ